MKRDLNVIRMIMQKTEELMPNKRLSLNDFKNMDPYVLSENVKQLRDEGFLICNVDDTLGSAPKQFIIRGLTWKGHDYLKDIESNTIWKKLKYKVAQIGGRMGFDVIKVVVLNAIKNTFGL